METNLKQSHVQAWQRPAANHDLDKQRLCILRILRCTAKAMASSPGGLRFKAGTRPWLDGLTGSPLGSAPVIRGVNPLLQATDD